MTTSPLRSHTQAADLILIAAEGSGLPMPTGVHQSARAIRFEFPEDIPQQWIDWAGALFAVGVGTDGAGFRGTLFDHPVELTAWVAS